MPFTAFASSWIDRINEKLGTYIPDDGRIPRELAEAMRFALLSPGKRIRPLLTLAAARTFAPPLEGTLTLACCAEMVHVSSLILDDLPCMDDALTRRGLPACHRKFSEETAILTAFGLLTEAFGLIPHGTKRLPSERYDTDAYVTLLTEAVGMEGMVGGQIMDLHPADTVDLNTLEYIHSHKTGALFVASAAFGAMSVNVKRKHLEWIKTYAKNLGLAFQIQDDLLDVTSTPEETGKEAQTPSRKTFVDLFGIERCREAVDHLLGASEEALTSLPGDPDLLKGLIDHVRTRKS